MGRLRWLLMVVDAVEFVWGWKPRLYAGAGGRDGREKTYVGDGDQNATGHDPIVVGSHWLWKHPALQ